MFLPVGQGCGIIVGVIGPGIEVEFEMKMVMEMKGAVKKLPQHGWLICVQYQGAAGYSLFPGGPGE
jgi:hypothetical protein